MKSRIFPYIGIRQIKLPLHANEITRETLEKYLPQIFNVYKKNAAKLHYCYDAYYGMHDILEKTRLYEESKENNNIVVEPHLLELVNFKVGYLSGNPAEYAEKDDVCTDDITALNKYLSEQEYTSVKSDILEFVYACGVGYTYTMRRAEEGLNLSHESPFKVVVAEPWNAFKVYSSYTGEEELFDVEIVDISENIATSIKKAYRICIFTPSFYYEFETTNFTIGTSSYLSDRSHEVVNGIFPLSEFYANRMRVGISEICVTLQNAINQISSSSIDNIVDVADTLFAFFNVDMSLETFSEACKNKVFLLKSNNPQFPADVKTLVNAFNHSDVNVKYEQLIKVLYDCVGVPRASGQNSSGGDTGEARNLGNGWENAYNIALKEVNSLKRGDRQQLRKILFLCKTTTGCPVNELYQGDIDIKYNINRSDNLLIKTQSLLQMEQYGVPVETALAIAEITSDPHAVAEGVAAYRTEKMNLQKELLAAQSKNPDEDKQSERTDSNKPQPAEKQDKNAK